MIIELAVVGVVVIVAAAIFLAHRTFHSMCVDTIIDHLPLSISNSFIN
jgi:hypothetical protein